MACVCNGRATPLNLPPPTSMSSLFGVKPGTAMILMEGVTYLDQERPVEYFKALYRGDRFKFVFESQRDVQVLVLPIVVETMLEVPYIPTDA